MTDPLVSVVIPVHNGERFLGEALESVCWQTYRRFEVILVDDGSTDRTWEIASAVPGLRGFRQDNLGPSAARNLALEQARGTLVAFLDADDTWTPDKLRVQVDAMLAAGSRFSTTWMREVVEPGTVLPAGWGRGIPIGEPSPVGVPSSWVAERGLFDEAGGFDVTYRKWEDLEWLVRAERAGVTPMVVPEVLLLRRLHGANASMDPTGTNPALLRALRQRLHARQEQVAEAADVRAPKKELVSVVIPVYNGEQYLAAAIESVRAQGAAVAEVIVVDDGSEDGSAALAEGWGAPVRCIRAPHGGIGAARNAGIEAAAGAFVAFLDADDLWTEGRLAAQLAAFEADPALDMVFGLAEQFRDDDLPVTGMQGQGPAIIAGAMLIRAESLRRVGPFATAIRMGEFIDWYSRAKDLGLRETLLQALVIRRRIHGENTGIREAGSRVDYTRVLRAALERRRAAGRE